MPGKRTVNAVSAAYEDFSTALLSLAAQQDSDEEPSYRDDPLPDRLRAALIDAVRACVSDIKDRHVANRVLGLSGDGESATLASIGQELGVVRERIRQRRIRAFRRIDQTLPRRIASAARLRDVLAAISADADWTDPALCAQAVVRLVNDRFSAARQLTLMLCRAAGAAGPVGRLRRAAEQAALEACRNPELLGVWRFDRWEAAAATAISAGPLARFEGPPEDMMGMKRMPGNGTPEDAIAFSSGKLGRVVACESGTELRIFSWLEGSGEVLWYQEQPVALPYVQGNRHRNYYPDIAVWDRQGRVVVVEVKPVFNMYRLETLIKSIAALDTLGPRGMGYLLVDATGWTLADLARVPYDLSAAEEVELLFARGPVSFRDVRNVLSRKSGRVELNAFASMVINRDWAVTGTPVSVDRLPDGMSFRPLLGLG